MRLQLETPLLKLPSIGRKRYLLFKKLGIEKVEDLLFYFPRKYIDMRNFKKISSLVPGETASVKATVLAREEKKLPGKVSYLKVAVSDGTGILFLIFFNQIYLKDVFLPEEKFFIHGKVENFNNELEMINPFFEKEEKRKRRDWIIPVYTLPKGLTQKYIRTLIKFILENLQDYPDEILPFQKRYQLRLPNIRYALKNIHFPSSEINLEKARNYLIFREFFILQLNLLWKKMKEQFANSRIKSEFEIDEKIIEEFEKLLPFKLTKDQKNVMKDIVEDIKRGKVIRRLIHGEVGSGKTVVGIFAMWIFSKMGYQSVFLSPTEILAEQHYLNWQEFFLTQNISVSFLIGQLPENEKKEIREKVKNGEIKVIFGTHALLTEKITYNNLKMVIIDEQHKFGVKQREILQQKGKHVHCLLMSATPIPRSIALTIYGGMDISKVGEIPKGERKVITYLFYPEEKEKIYKFIEYQSEEGKQGFIVVPSIKGNEDIKSAIEEYETVKNKLPHIPSEIIHGRLSHQEKERIMEKFRKKEIKLLVATTVIELGIDVPEASYIIIENLF